MPWLIDSDILIEGERENPAFVPWLALQAEVATAHIIRAEFLSAKVKSCCSEGESPSSLGRKAPEFRTKELDGKV